MEVRSHVVAAVELKGVPGVVTEPEPAWHSEEEWIRERLGRNARRVGLFKSLSRFYGGVMRANVQFKGRCLRCI